MCHRIVAEKVCEDCGLKLGETVIGFDACSRKCANPAYRLSSEPFEQLCLQCAATHPDPEYLTSDSEQEHNVLLKSYDTDKLNDSKQATIIQIRAAQLKWKGY